jgi:hypothetical protein
VVHTDEGFPTTIGDRVTVGHRAILHGCTVEDDADRDGGDPAERLPRRGRRGGRAGAVVREGQHVPPGTLAVGVPAQIRQVELPPVPRRNVAGYLALAELYRRRAVRGCHRRPGAPATDGDPSAPVPTEDPS